MQTKCFRYGEGGRIKTTWPDLEFGRYTAILLIVQLRAKFIYLFTFGENWAVNSKMVAIRLQLCSFLDDQLQKSSSSTLFCQITCVLVSLCHPDKYILTWPKI